MSNAKVADCAVSSCSFNQDGCHAIAVSIADSCATFIDLGSVGGIKKASAEVGACHLSDCVHNDALLCTSASVQVGDAAKCLTYTVK